MATSAMKARSQAVQELIGRHREEFDTILGDLREAAGLPRISGGLSPQARQARIAKHLEALKKLGVEVNGTTEA